MNEKNAVLDFFAQPENLPLGLSVAEQMDEIRERMNSQFWKNFNRQVDSLLSRHAPEWQAHAIEDRNAAEMLVGLQCKLGKPQTLCLFPMLEQQYLGGNWRIFYGLMWQGAPTVGQLALPAVSQLKQVLSGAGYKSNENFLAWQWTNFYPRRSDFLQRYALQPEKLLDEVESVFRKLPLDLIGQANAALKDAPPSQAISLDQLRKKRGD